jgi:methyl-accepting chemotaxis protein
MTESLHQVLPDSSVSAVLQSEAPLVESSLPRFAAIALFGLLLLCLLMGVWMASEVWDILTTRSWPGAIAASALLSAMVAGIAYWWLSRLLEEQRQALESVQQVIERARVGDTSARSYLIAADPIGRLGRALDVLLDQRGQLQTLESRANNELNNSVIEIMRSVGEIATSKDLSIKIPVNDDVTGAIAEALNLLNEETSRVLTSMSRISRSVAQATLSVRTQSESAAAAAGRERHEVELAARELGRAAAALNAISERARACNDIADQAVKATVESVRGVNETVGAIAQSRELIRETEKRIKRLGERSQEIGQIVTLIQDMAERTGILALNASMHALAAGEAGRNFVTVADQVKRLSESAKDSSADIGRLVISIQTETHETVIAMNQAISKVVEISQLADGAGQGMRRSQECTESLASSVREIARTSVEQAKVGAGLQERARIIQEASAETARQLTSQAIETRRLAEYAKVLSDEVSVFKLPTINGEDGT